MNVSIGIMPIIIFFVVLYILSNLISRINNSGKNIRWMLIGYVGLLVLSTIVYFLLPIEGDIASEALQPDEIQLQGVTEGESGTIEIHDPLYEHLNNGTMNELENSYVREKWSFDYLEAELNIRSIQERTYMSIYVEEVEEMDQAVEVTFYQLPMIIENQDISKYTSLPTVDLSSTSLTIEEPERADLTFATFKPEFPFRQFSGDKLMPEHGYSNELIYIRVADNIQLDVEDDITIIGEDW